MTIKASFIKLLKTLSINGNFSIYMDDLVATVNSSGVRSGPTINGWKYRMLMYADDIVLFATFVRARVVLSKIFEDHSIGNRYRFSVPKSNVILGLDSESLSAPKIYGSKLQMSPEFTFLDCTYDEYGVDWPSHPKRRGQRAMGVPERLCASGPHDTSYD